MISETNRKKIKSTDELISFERSTKQVNYRKNNKSNVKWRQSHRNWNVRGEERRKREFEEVGWCLCVCERFCFVQFLFGFWFVFWPLSSLLCCVLPSRFFFYFFHFLHCFFSNGLIILLMLILTVLYESTCRNVRYKLTEKNKMRINLC